MKILKKYNQFISENVFTEEIVDTFNDIDILESIVTDTDSLLNSIQAEEFDLYSVFELDKNKFNFETIEDLHKNEHFDKVLEQGNLKKETIESTMESETFIDKAIDIKFFLIHKKDDNQLSQPIAIIFQSKLRKNTKWDEIKAYKVKEDMKKFYDKLSSKTIEIKKGNKNYIYNTSNSGNDWQLSSPNKSDIFKEYMNKKDIKALLKDHNDVSITIIE